MPPNDYETTPLYDLGDRVLVCAYGNVQCRSFQEDAIPIYGVDTELVTQAEIRRWWPVEELLPLPHRPVLVRHSDGFYFLSVLGTFTTITSEERRIASAWSKGYRIEATTHWMELPPGPEVQ